MALTNIYACAVATFILIVGGMATDTRAGDTASRSEAATGMSSEEKQRFEAIIRQYILDHPEVVIESLQAHHAKQQAEEQQRSQAALAMLKDEIGNDPATPVAGNPEGDVTIVEFFDYRCGYCKRVLPSIQKLIESDGNIRYVFKEYPVLGPASVTAARAALAVWSLQPDKYFAFHTALLETRGNLTEKRILQVAEQVGLDPARVRDMMDDPKIEEALQQNFALGRQINVTGTPAFIIGDKLVPGAIDFATMKQMVETARNS